MLNPRVVNETTLDTRRVGAIVRYVFRHLDLDGARVVVKIKNHRGRYAYSGHFYSNPARHGGYVLQRFAGGYDDWREVKLAVPPGTRALIVCRVGAPTVYPRLTHVYARRDAPEPWEVADPYEALVSITAHEAMHLRQSRRRAGGGNHRGRYNEIETEWAAKRILDAWRAR